MKTSTKILFLLCVIFFLPGKGIMNAQSITFNWNGTVSNIAGYPEDSNGSIQTWTVPPCVNVITIIAQGGAGGDCDLGNYENGGDAAIVTGTVTVTPGNVLDIIVAGKGAYGDIDGGGGGGGSYIWNTSTSQLLVVAGGGGGAGLNEFGPTGQTNNSSAAALEAATIDGLASCGAGGVGGNGGAAGAATNLGAGCGGAGWLSCGKVVAPGTYYYTGYGIYPKNPIYPGYGGIADPFFTNPYEGAGGYGGAAGGGYNGGGGGGGYNGAGGGLGTGGAAGYAGGGGGSYCDGGIALSTSLGTSGSDGSVTIDWNGSGLTASITSSTNEPCNGDVIGTAIATAAGGVAPYTYTWSTVPVQSGTTATGLSAGTYTVSVVSAGGGGCTATVSVSITQPPVLTATMGAITYPFCTGGTGTATVNAAGGTGPYTYAWTPRGGSNALTVPIIAGNYTVNVTDNHGCVATASVVITQPATGVTVNLTGPPMVCFGSTGTLTATAIGGTMPYTYAWSSGLTSTTSTATIAPVTTTTYTVSVTDINGCSASADITVANGPAVFAAITGGNNFMCAGTSTTLCANATGGTGGNTYTWQPGGMTGPCVTVLPSSTTTYTLTIADNCGSTATASTTVNINPFPLVEFSANVTQGCAPLCVQFYNTTTLAQGGAAQYVWTFGNGDTIQEKSPIYCYGKGGQYDITLTATSDSGCSSTLKKVRMINAFSAPLGAFTLSPQPADILNPTIQFTDMTKDSYNIIFWTWNFGDATDSTSNKPNPSHTYLDTGSYCARMVVMDAHGCLDTTTNCLIIDPVFDFYIPSAFSPNGDSKNPTFQPKGSYIKDFDMYIFDRWGMLLYHTTDINKGWDGTVNGGSTIAQEDTYEYKIQVTDSKNKQHSYVGNVTLLK